MTKEDGEAIVELIDEARKRLAKALQLSIDVQELRMTARLARFLYRLQDEAMDIERRF